MNNPLQLLSQSPAKQNNTTKTKMTTHPRSARSQRMVSSLPAFPFAFPGHSSNTSVLLTCSPQTLPTAAHRCILICTSTPASYSPIFWGHVVGGTPSCASAARRVPIATGPRWGSSVSDGAAGGVGCPPTMPAPGPSAHLRAPLWGCEGRT